MVIMVLILQNWSHSRVVWYSVSASWLTHLHLTVWFNPSLHPPSSCSLPSPFLRHTLWLPPSPSAGQCQWHSLCHLPVWQPPHRQRILSQMGSCLSWGYRRYLVAETHTCMITKCTRARVHSHLRRMLLKQRSCTSLKPIIKPLTFLPHI